MGRIERTEIFGRHVICATASSSLNPASVPRWDVQVSALERGTQPDGPLKRFPTIERALVDPNSVLEQALRDVRRRLLDEEASNTPR